MFCAFLGHTGERLQDHWSSGFNTYKKCKINIFINQISFYFHWKEHIHCSKELKEHLTVFPYIAVLNTPKFNPNFKAVNNN